MNIDTRKTSVEHDNKIIRLVRDLYNIVVVSINTQQAVVGGWSDLDIGLPQFPPHLSKM